MTECIGCDMLFCAYLLEVEPECLPTKLPPNTYAL